jgi:hypothetical protein
VVTSVTVTFPTGGTIFIGSTAQLQARETLNDGTTRPAANATWGSDAPGVATVSGSGLVSAVAAGEATIFADSGARGVLRIRVFPRFSGSWTGTESIASCQATGDFGGVCGDPEFAVGTPYSHDSTFTQNDATVGAVLDGGSLGTATTTGTVSLGGELELLPTLFPANDATIELRNWRCRTDQPGRMTGTYLVVASAAGLQGSFTLEVRMLDVRRSSGLTQGVNQRPTGGSSLMGRTAEALRRTSGRAAR